SVPAIAKALGGKPSKPVGHVLATHPLGEQRTDDCAIALELAKGRTLRFDTVAFCFPTAAAAKAVWTTMPIRYRWKSYRKLAGVATAAIATSTQTDYFVYVLSGRGIYGTAVETSPRGPYAPSAAERARIAQAHRAGLRGC